MFRPVRSPTTRKYVAPREGAAGLLESRPKEESPCETEWLVHPSSAPGVEGRMLDRGVLHVGPDPRGGWLVEAEDHRIVPSSYQDLEHARREAQSYATAYGWRLIVHDERHPAADSAPAGQD